MNYSNVFGRTQKQFDMTMNREKITVTDFSNSDIKYDVLSKTNAEFVTVLNTYKSDLEEIKSDVSEIKENMKG